MRGARVFSSTLLSLVVGLSTAAYAQGEHGKKPDPAASKPEQQQQPANSPPGQARQAPPPAHVQPVAQPQRAQAPPSARQRAPARQAAQPVVSAPACSGACADPSENTSACACSGENSATTDRPGENSVTSDRSGENRVTSDRSGENRVASDCPGENSVSSDRPPRRCAAPADSDGAAARYAIQAAPRSAGSFQSTASSPDATAETHQ